MLSGWLRAANPFDSPSTPNEALRKSRCGSIALVLRALHGAASATWLYLNHERMLELLRPSLPDAPEALQFGLLFSAVMSALFVVIYLVLAAVQWFRPTRWIPITMILLNSYGLLAGITAMVLPPAGLPELNTITPDWLPALGWGVTVVATALHLSSWRGANKLLKMRAQHLQPTVK